MPLEYVKTEKWTTSTDRFEFCKNILREKETAIFAEIGVWKGEFAAYILENCPSIEAYYMIDPWAHLGDWNKPANVPHDRFEHIYDLAMAATDFAAARRLVKRMTTLAAVKNFEDNYFDAVYIDGDHTLRGITLDLLSLYPKVKTGGLILGDDLSPTIWQHPDKYEPSFVFPFAVHFAEAMGCPIIAGPFNQFVILKNPDMGFHMQDLTKSYPATDILEQIRNKTL